MSQEQTYRSHFLDPRHRMLFSGFKEFVLPYELDAIDAVVDVLSDRTDLWRDANPKKVCEIGFGDLRITKHFLWDFGPLDYTGIEIVPEYVHIADADKQLQSYSSVIYPINAEVFSTSLKYHLIYSFNSWYGMSTDAIATYANRLREDGLLAIVLNEESGFITQLASALIDEPIQAANSIEVAIMEAGLPYESIPLPTKTPVEKERVYCDGTITSQAEVAIRYILRRFDDELDDVAEYLHDKPEEFFQMPQKLFLISAP